MSDDPLYRELLLEHYREPRAKYAMKDCDIDFNDSNPLCGDSIEIFAKVKDGNIQDLSFLGQGCVISMASASMLMDELKGKRLSDIQKMDDNDILKILNLKLTPTRLKCAMLPLVALKKGIIGYESKLGK